jgi:hypothetical protein
MSRAAPSGHSLDLPAGGENSRVNVTDAAIAFMVGQQIEQQRIIETEAAQEHFGGSHLQNLPRGKTFKDIGNLLANAKTENGRFPIGTNHVLRQHHVGEIDFLYVVVGVSRFHWKTPCSPAPADTAKIARAKRPDACFDGDGIINANRQGKHHWKMVSFVRDNRRRL